jgi:hypothetical protein
MWKEWTFRECSLMISSTIGAILSATIGLIPLRIIFSIVAAL